ncbi:MAG: hypothetical protein OES57_05910, partial [Acidimicrobiia bacterium]|nr:hypothetical protein [Acidimicrobiia bacterium]
LRWSAEQRAQQARTDRVRQASLRRQAAVASRWRGVLLDLAEQGEPVELMLRSGPVCGTLTAVGEDFCALGQPDRMVLIATAGIGQIGAGADLPYGFRGVQRATSLAEVLAELSHTRPVVQVQAAIGPTRTGRLERAGLDVVTIRTDHPDPRSVSFNLAVVDAVTMSA